MSKNISEDMRTLRRLLSSHPERVAAAHVVDVLNRAQTAIEAKDCQFNCRAKRKEDYSAGWKAAQEFDECADVFGDDLADKRYGLNWRFEAYIKKAG